MKLFKKHFQTQLNNTIKEDHRHRQKNAYECVLGYGSLEAGIMFISDMPGPKDARLGIPFIGKAKKRIVAAISDIGLKKGDYYFTYLIKHLTNPKDILHTPSYDRYVENLIKEIEIIDPLIICTMGFYSTKSLMKYYNMDEKAMDLNDLHGNGYVIPARKKGKEIIRHKRFLVPTWDPSIDKPIMNMQFADDMLTIKTVSSLWMLLDRQ